MNWLPARQGKSVDLTKILARFGLVMAAAILPAMPAPAQTPGLRLLAETEELAGMLENDRLRILDVRGGGDKGETAYRAGHIPGAVFLTTRALDDAAANAEGLPIPPERAAELFSRLGVDHDTKVVAYDDAGGRFAARVFYVLEFFGHRHVRVLNGGLEKWLREGRPVTGAKPRVPPTEFVPRVRPGVIATTAYVRNALDNSNVTLIDARSRKEYSGQVVRAERGGHIPGAVHLEWSEALRHDRTFKSDTALSALFASAGVRPARETIVYCQSGARAAHSYFALRLLGHSKVKIYDGSWKEWGNRPDLPVEE